MILIYTAGSLPAADARLLALRNYRHRLASTSPVEEDRFDWLVREGIRLSARSDRAELVLNEGEGSRGE